MSSADKFVELYNLPENYDAAVYTIDPILMEYGNPDEDIGEVFTRLPGSVQQEVMSYLTSHLNEGETGYAQELYEEALQNADRDRYYQGVVDMYEALQAEGLI